MQDIFKKILHHLFFGQQGVNREGSGIRAISNATARAEILRLYKLYNRIYFNWDNDVHYDTRTNYQNYIVRQENEYRSLNNQTQIFSIHGFDIG